MMAAATQLPFGLTRSRRGRLDRRRRRYAEGLERAVRAARHPVAAGTLTSAIAVQRRAVLQERSLLLELAGLVREADGAPASAFDPVRRLLTDGNSPLYVPSGPGALQAAVLEAMLALDHDGPQPA
jgi:hypothetical protein